ncbi:MAG: hypothetical protein MUF04_15010 [Akkermansiaceae bacterium]|nr:hypothetical protein [Akkermansiaceae bacterium]
MHGMISPIPRKPLQFLMRRHPENQHPDNPTVKSNSLTINSLAIRGSALLLLPVLTLVIGFQLGSRRHQVRDAVVHADPPALPSQAEAVPLAKANPPAGDPAKTAKGDDLIPIRNDKMGEIPSGSEDPKNREVFWEICNCGDPRFWTRLR